MNKCRSRIYAATIDEGIELYLPPTWCYGFDWDEEDLQKLQSWKKNQECLIEAFRGRYLKHYIQSSGTKYYWTERQWNEWKPPAKNY